MHVAFPGEQVNICTIDKVHLSEFDSEQTNQW